MTGRSLSDDRIELELRDSAIWLENFDSLKRYVEREEWKYSKVSKYYEHEYKEEKIVVTALRTIINILQEGFKK